MCVRAAPPGEDEADSAGHERRERLRLMQKQVQRERHGQPERAQHSWNSIKSSTAISDVASLAVSPCAAARPSEASKRAGDLAIQGDGMLVAQALGVRVAMAPAPVARPALRHALGAHDAVATAVPERGAALVPRMPEPPDSRL